MSKKPHSGERVLYNNFPFHLRHYVITSLRRYSTKFARFAEIFRLSRRIHNSLFTIYNLLRLRRRIRYQ